MKYVFLFCSGSEERDEWNTMPDTDRMEWYNRIAGWFEDNAQLLIDTHQLQGVETTRTVRFDNGSGPMVTDGPYIESNEIVGGYAVVEVQDRAAAINLAKTWPGAGPLEVRPIVDHSAA